jgi:small subunit ribosomal protein S13
LKEVNNKSDDIEEDGEIQHIVRIAETDLDGKAQVLYSLTGLKGINRRIARVLAISAGVNPSKKMGYLSEEEIHRLKEAVENIEQIVPVWMLNRRKDFLTGENKHIYGSDLAIVLREDLNVMKKTRSYKGIRHEKGLKVRGQRTKSTGRRGATVGVSRKK